MLAISMIFKVSGLRIEINGEQLQDTFCVESVFNFLIVYRVADTLFIYYFYGFTRDATFSSIRTRNICVRKMEISRRIINR